MKGAALGAKASSPAEAMDQIVVPPVGAPSARAHGNAVPPQSWTSMPRCSRYQPWSAFGSLAWKKMPPMPVTRSMGTSVAMGSVRDEDATPGTIVRDVGPCPDGGAAHP